MEAVRNKKASQKCLDSGRKIDGTLPIPDKNLAEYIAAAGTDFKNVFQLLIL